MNNLKSNLANKFKRIVTFGESHAKGIAASKTSARGAPINGMIEEFKDDLVLSPSLKIEDLEENQT